LCSKFFEELVAHAGVPMYAVRPSEGFRFVYANAAACRHFGRSADDLSQLTIIQVDPNATLDGCERFLTTIRRDRSAVFETVHTRPDGSTVPVEVTSSLLESEDDEILIGHIVNLTGNVERARFEADLRERQRTASLAEMASTVAHDFNNLLVGILANVAHAASTMPGPEARTALEDAEAAARDAAELCRQLLAFSGEGRIVTDNTTLEEILESSRALIRRAIANEHEIVLRPASSPTRVEVQVQQIQQALIDVVRNASEALGVREGAIIVSSGVADLGETELRAGRAPANARPGPHAYLEVADSGPGIDPAVLPRIFEPFFSTRKVGRGLGLSAALGAVQSHGGAITVESERGRRTVVRLYLPVAAERREVERSVVVAAHPGCVLVVDDEIPIQRAARRILQRAGFEVEVASSGIQALTLLQGGLDPGCVLLDLTMPGLGGRETLARIRQLRPSLPVVLTSGYDATGIAEAESVPGVAFLPKPFGPVELRSAIETAVGPRSRR
jgi:PAS domain S-box-containing protein